MSDKLPNDKDGLLELLKKLWVPVAGFIGAITLVYNFYQLWLGDQATITYITTGAGLVVLVIALGWVGYSRKTVILGPDRPFGPVKTKKTSRYSCVYQWIARISLGVVLLSVTIGAWGLINYQRELDDKVNSFEKPQKDLMIL